MFLKSEKTIVLEIMKFYGFQLINNGIIRNYIEANIQFYRVVRVIPKITVQINTKKSIKFIQILMTVNLLSENKIICEKRMFLVYKISV